MLLVTSVQHQYTCATNLAFSLNECLGHISVPVIYDDDDDDQKKKRTARRTTWDGSRDSSTVAQLLSDGKGLHGYGSSGRRILDLL